MPELRQQDQAIQSELQSLETVAGDQAKYLRLVETLADFHARLQARAETLDVPERQKILRLLVKEVLVGRETITIRHSIRMPNSAPDPSGAPRAPHAPEPPPAAQPDPCYHLRSGRHFTAVGQHLPEQVGSELGGAVEPNGNSGPIRRRSGGDVPHEIGGEGSAPADRAGDQPAGSGAAAGDEAGAIHGDHLYRMGLHKLTANVKCRAQASPRGSSLSRVPESGMHGLKGGNWKRTDVKSAPL
jgi:site-specific DNA recombinase